MRLQMCLLSMTSIKLSTGQVLQVSHAVTTGHCMFEQRVLLQPILQAVRDSLKPFVQAVLLSVYCSRPGACAIILLYNGSLSTRQCACTRTVCTD